MPPLRDHDERVCIAISETLMRLIAQATMFPETVSLCITELEPFLEAEDGVTGAMYGATIAYLRELQSISAKSE